MDRLQTLEVFIAVADAGGFAAGARTLGLSPPSVTRGINALEQRLGARLFTRTTRRMRLTDVGLAYLEDARQIIAQLRAADDAASGAATTPVGQLRITCPSEFGRIYVVPIVTDFLDAYSDVTADVLMVDRIVNLVEEGFDLAVRIGPLPASSLSAVRVGEVRRVLCGAPAYLSSQGIPEAPDDLRAHRLVTISSVSPSTSWRFGAELQHEVTVSSRLVVNSVAAGLEVARQGWGLCRALSYQIGPDLHSGILQTVLEEYEPAPLPVHLVHVEGRRAVAKVRSFIEFARDRLKSHAAGLALG